MPGFFLSQESWPGRSANVGAGVFFSLNENFRAATGTQPDGTEAINELWWDLGQWLEAEGIILPLPFESRPR
jgi:hypothetical protein